MMGFNKAWDSYQKAQEIIADEKAFIKSCGQKVKRAMYQALLRTLYGVLGSEFKGHMISNELRFIRENLKDLKTFKDPELDQKLDWIQEQILQKKKAMRSALS